MSRWKPDARGRLEQAAYELFRDRGYERTTVADIAERAGLSERTFFRHYADKREVLFGGSPLLETTMVAALDALPSAASTIEAVRSAVEAVANILHGRHEHARERQNVIAANDALQERGLIKRATLTAALARALVRRGVPEAEAALAAEMGISVFYVGFDRWLTDRVNREFVDVVRAEFEQLQALVAGRTAPMP